MKGCVAWVAAAFTIFLLVFSPCTAWSERVAGPEYEVKAGFIYNFASFVTWPDKAFNKNEDLLVLCFASDDPSSNVLFMLDGKTVNGRKIKVIAYKDGGCIDQSHIFFFGTQDKVFIQKILNITRGMSVLTIGEIEGFTEMGGVINFFQEQNRLRFKVNIDAAKRQGLTMSSQLLVSAQIVKEEHE